MDISPDYILYAVIALSWVEFLWEAYIWSRQWHIYRTRTTLPTELEGIMKKETFDKERLYSLHKAQFSAVQRIFSQVVSTALLWFYGMKFVWDLAGEVATDETYRSWVFVFYCNLFSLVMGIPFSVYSVFVLEERPCNKHTVPFYVMVQIMKFVVGQVTMLPLVDIIIKIIHWGGDFFFLYLWFFVFVFTICTRMIIIPIIIGMIGRPLPEGELRTKIEELTASIHFPLYKLFVVEVSKLRLGMPGNAFFYGFFKCKGIVLFDTLLEASEREKLKTEEDKAEEEKQGADLSEEEAARKEEEDKMMVGCDTPEILAVLAHELGHWSLNHGLKKIVIDEMQIFLRFALYGYLYNMQPLYTAFGFPDSRPVLIGLMVIGFVTAPYNAVLDFAMTALSRRFEFQADAFAASLGHAAQLRTALVKLHNDNLGFPVYDWLFSAWHHSHPPLLERMAALDKDDKKEN